MSKTAEEMAEEYGADIDLCCGTSDIIIAVEKSFLAGYKAAQELYAAKLKEANDTIDGMVDECEGLKTIIYDNEQTNLPTSAKWISVKDRLPEDYVDVLWYDPISLQQMRVDMNGALWRADFTNGSVTHWQPLPAPPKEEE